MPLSSHDMIIRQVYLLPVGQREPDWVAARQALSKMGEDALDQVAERWGQLDRYDLAEWPADAEPTRVEMRRHYLTKALAAAEKAWQTHDDDEIAFYHYPRSWRGRTGAVILGYDFDEVPEGVAPALALAEAGLLEAAGFEEMP